MGNEARVAGRGRVAVAGSIAFDHILEFPGQFKDHILPEKLDVINLSFLVSTLSLHRGGCAPNIAYTMALLGHEPRIVGAAGHDFFDYGKSLQDLGIDIDGVVQHVDERTASCHTTCDLNGCSIMGFHVGAMSRAREISLATAVGPGPVLAIVAPDDPEAMSRNCEEARRAGIPFFFDPSFQVIALDGPKLLAAAEGAQALVVNEYEQAVFQEKTGKSGAELLELVGMMIVTLGGKGSRLELPGGEVLSIPSVPIAAAVDPTGAGDAYRGGFLAGWAEGRSLEVCGRMGSVAGAFAVEQRGTQEHRYDRTAFLERYQSNFGPMPDTEPGLIEERWGLA